MNRILEVSNLEDIKIVIDPFRAKIMKHLQKEGPATVKQIGDAFNEAPSKMLYHIKKLEKVGAVAIVKTEVINGIIAKYYDLIIDEVSIKSKEEDEESLEYIKKAFEEQWIEYYDNARAYAENMMKKSDKKDEIQPLDGIMGENYVYLNEEELGNFSSELSDIIKKYIKNPKENRNKYHVLKSIIRVE